MNNWLQSKSIGIGLISILALIFSYLLLTGNSKILLLLSGGIIGLVLVYFLFFHSSLSVKLLVFFAPLSISLSSGGGAISFPTEIGSLLLLFFSMILVMKGKPINKEVIKHPISIVLIIDLFIYLASSIFSTMPIVSFKRLFLKLIFITVYYFIFSHFFKKNRNYSLLYLIYSIGLIIPIFYTLIHHSEYGFTQKASFLMGLPFYADHTIFGASLAFVIPFLILWTRQIITHKSRALIILAVLFTLFMISTEILTYSRASWVSLLIVLLLSIGLRFNIKFWQVLCFLALGSIFITYNFNDYYQDARGKEIKTANNVFQHFSTIGALQNDASNLERINRWLSAYRMFEEKPMLGFGPGTYQFKYGPYQSVNYKTRISTNDGDLGTAHSEYFTALSETGLAGLLTLLFILFYSLHLGLKLYYIHKEDPVKRLAIYSATAGLLTFFVHGLFNNFLDAEKISILVYGSLSILVVIDIETKKALTT